MKIFLMLAGIYLILFTATCRNTNQNSDTMEVTGRLEPIGMTTWQYGTHTISDDEDFYALRGKEVNLQEYEGKQVTITATKVEGYPVDGGPVFLEVTSIKEP